MSENNLSPVEKIKMQSDGLRGTIRESLLDEITGAISEDDQSLVKFHGMYQQDDRDRREERAEKKLERLYSFMIRLRLPGGFLTPQQWIAMHHVAGEAIDEIQSGRERDVDAATDGNVQEVRIVGIRKQRHHKHRHQRSEQDLL